ncbi:SDR family NAD(P)-dependent oxidoreductase [Mycolicibacterium psychrotolerans]|uniref:Short-chain dehydrogenase n=1 Tax=Mycolicibacterium psychrotolerans TaxID=216929 RepID=A0A7I7M5C7_9MYCO|nr:SDR family NAD(P)-dependent oxidoreductase [Mycolicibacterium psychrotolerans]BBX67062.1 short-chain dehydrogenase [Mycolicibacterium psychrotolerans]
MTDIDSRNDARVVAITGASSGIGRETALRYSARRARLVLAARSEGALRDVADECRAAGADAVVVAPTDISDAAQVRDMFDLAIEMFGHVDVAAQCAAITAFGRFEDVPPEVFDAIIATNLLGAANVARTALQHFQERGAGQLVLVGSLLGVTAVPYQSAYVASKFAICGLVRALRQENRHLPGVRVHGIYPGPVDTPVYASAGNYLDQQTPRVPPTSESPGAIAAAIVRAAEKTRSTERQVGWVNLPAIATYRLVPAVFDAVIGPLIRRVMFTSESSADSAGNVFEPPAARRV